MTWRRKPANIVADAAALLVRSSEPPGQLMLQVKTANIRLLGRFAVELPGEPDRAIEVSSRKGCALFAYLVMQPEQYAEREHLATLLWGNHVDQQARQSLRQCLVVLRKELAPVGAELLVFERDAVRVRAGAVTADALEFMSLADSHSGADLQRASALYRGEFLAGIGIDSESFNEWIQQQRDRTNAAAARVFAALAARCDSNGGGEQAIGAAERLIALDPLREDWQRLLLSLLARYRSREAALAHAARMTALLRDELDVAPEPETAKLIAQIKQGFVAPVPLAAPSIPEVSAPSLASGSNEVVAETAAPADRDERSWSAPGKDRAAATPGGRLDARPRGRWPSLVFACATAAAVIGVAGFGVWPLMDGRSPSPPATHTPSQSTADGPPPTADMSWNSPRLPVSASADAAALAARAIIPILVLPFTTPAGVGNAEQAIAEAMTGDLINSLSRFRDFRVISHHTALSYRGRPVDVAAVGAELGVRYLVEGSIRSQEGRLRINVQLVDAATRSQVWADSFEREQAHTLAIQDEIIKRLCRALQVEAVYAESRRTEHEPANEQGVDALMARAVVALFRGPTHDNMTEALGLFEQVLQRQPHFTPAMVGAARAHNTLAGNFLVADPGAHWRHAEELLRGALRRHPDSPNAHYQLGVLNKGRGRPGIALQHYARAAELNPSMPYVYADIGHTLIRVGRAAESLEHIRYAMRLSPKDPNIGYWQFFAGEAELELGNDQVALQWFQRARTHFPAASPFGHGWLAAAHALLGNKSEAVRHAAGMRKLMPEGRLERWIRGLERDRDRMQRRRLHEGITLALAWSS